MAPPDGDESGNVCGLPTVCKTAEAESAAIEQLINTLVNFLVPLVSLRILAMSPYCSIMIAGC
jgi:hypothetical protein